MGLSDALSCVCCNVCTCINQTPTGVLVLPSSLTQNKTLIMSLVVGLSVIFQVRSVL